MSRDALAPRMPPDVREMLRHRVLQLKRPIAGRGHGRHPAPRAGQGLDFRDHRAYVAGDDLRRLDWRAIARRDRLVLRQTEAEDELPVMLIVDGGGGMAYGEGWANKARAAGALACAIAWLASAQGDPVGFVRGSAGDFDAGTLRPSKRGERLTAIARQLEEASAGVCPWIDMLGSAAAAVRRRSVVFVFSDLLDPAGTREAGERDADEQLLRALTLIRDRRHEVVLVQTLHRDELEFPWADRGMLRFIDLWSTRPQVDGQASALRQGYLERLHAHLRWWDESALREGLTLVRVRTDESLAEALQRLLGRSAGAA